jgi:hypothetical protein
MHLNIVCKRLQYMMYQIVPVHKLVFRSRICIWVNGNRLGSIVRNGTPIHNYTYPTKLVGC